MSDAQLIKIDDELSTTQSLKDGLISTEPNEDVLAISAEANEVPISVEAPLKTLDDSNVLTSANNNKDIPIVAVKDDHVPDNDKDVRKRSSFSHLVKRVSPTIDPIIPYFLPATLFNTSDMGLILDKGYIKFRVPDELLTENFVDDDDNVCSDVFQGNRVEVHNVFEAFEVACQEKKYLSSVFEAISFSLHKTTSKAHFYHDIVMKHYKIGPDTKKNKLPIYKLFNFMSKPNAVLSGKTINFIIISDRYNPNMPSEVCHIGRYISSPNISAPAKGATPDKITVALKVHGLDIKSEYDYVVHNHQPTNQSQYSLEWTPCSYSGMLPSHSMINISDTTDSSTSSSTTEETPRGIVDIRPSFEDVNDSDCPFSKVRYPTLDMTDTGFNVIIKSGLHSAFGRNRVRMILTIILHLVACGVASSMLYFSTDKFNSCCTNSTNSTSDQNYCDIDIYNPKLVINPHEKECYRDMCNTTGILRSKLPSAYFWATTLSLGRVLAVAIIVCVFALILTLATSFFSIRPVALKGATPRFWIVTFIMHILCGMVICGASIYILFETLDDIHNVDKCEVYGDDFLTDQCEAHIKNCDIRISFFYDDGMGPVLRYLNFAFIVSSGLALLFSFIPPLPTRNTIDIIPPAKPDTKIFKVGPYAPDGITEEEIKDLRNEIKEQWTREKLNDTIINTRKNNHATNIFLTGSNPKQDISSKGVSTVNIFQTLPTGTGLVKNKFHIHTPDPFGHRKASTLPPSIEYNVDLITRRVLQRLKDGHVEKEGVGCEPIAPSDSNVHQAPAMCDGHDGHPGFMDVVKGLDADKIEAELHDEHLRSKIIDRLVARIKMEKSANPKVAVTVNTTTGTIFGKDFLRPSYNGAP